MPNDIILAVGLGTGSTLIPICKLLNDGGFYTVIEASSSQISKAKLNIELNKIDNSRYEIINGYAGQVHDTWGSGNQRNININEYQFDILELDCEGSELSIIQNLLKKPRFIIVELHPGYFNHEFKSFEVFLNLMNGKGYEYTFSYGHNGDYLTL